MRANVLLSPTNENGGETGVRVTPMPRGASIEDSVTDISPARVTEPKCKDFVDVLRR
jgi:hypothetical protein